MKTGATMTRRGWLARLLMAAAVAPVAGLRLAAPVGAGKKKKPKTPSVAERTEDQRYGCEEEGGGKQAVMDGPNGGNTTECKGGLFDGITCINTKTSTKCFKQQTPPPTWGGVDPSDIADQPLEPLEPSDSPLTEPGQVADQPLQPVDGGDVTLYAGHGIKRLKASHHGKHKRNGRGKDRRR